MEWTLRWAYGSRMSGRPPQKATVQGITAENVGPYTYKALKKVLQLCPAIRSVQIRTNVESGIPPDQQVQFYGNYFLPALRDCGRPVTLDLRGWILASGMSDAMTKSGLPLRCPPSIGRNFWGRPYQPAETWPGYSYREFAEEAAGLQFLLGTVGWGRTACSCGGIPAMCDGRFPPLGWAGRWVLKSIRPWRRRVLGIARANGDIFTEPQQQRVFWKWEFERYWLFYMLWGRLSYDPKTPDCGVAG